MNRILQYLACKESFRIVSRWGILALLGRVFGDLEKLAADPSSAGHHDLYSSQCLGRGVFSRHDETFASPIA